MKLTLLICVLAITVNQSLLAQSSAEKDVLQFERDACKTFLEADASDAGTRANERLHINSIQWRGEHARE